MEIGLKYFSTNPASRLRGIEKFADFLEILPVPGKFELLKALKKPGFKYKVHAPHIDFGFNPCDKRAEKENLEMLKESIRAADFLEADAIVVHPGYNSEKLKIKNPEQNMADFFSKISDDRIFLENTMLEYEGVRYFGGNVPEELKKVLDEFKFKLCFDFCHAAATAFLLKTDYKELTKMFLKLKPAYFHVADKLLDGNDQHLHLGEGKLDMDFIKRVVKEADKPVCLEVPLDLVGRRKDAEFLRR